MKRLLLASTAVFALAGAAMAEDVTLGISLGFTGPLESMAPPMAAAVEMAAKEVTDSGVFLGGGAVSTARGDNTCIDAAASVAVVERLITVEKVKGIVGGMCSGETIASLQNVAMPNGVVMIAPSATSPALSTMEVNDLFYRTSPSDARQGVVMTELLLEEGIKTAAVTYTNNDYGKGLADSFAEAFEAAGGKVTINIPHEDGKADYSAEVGALAAAGGDILVIAGYIDQGGAGILRGALDTDAFQRFNFPDGMVTSALPAQFGAELSGTGSIGQNPAAVGEGRDRFIELAKAAGFDGSAAFAAESYDAAALILLAMAKAKSSDPAVYKKEILGIANGEGEVILPGQLKKAIEILDAGGSVNYEGATGVTFVNGRESAGSYRVLGFVDGEMIEIGYR